MDNVITSDPKEHTGFPGVSVAYHVGVVFLGGFFGLGGWCK